jgi:hypothetical protein
VAAVVRANRRAVHSAIDSLRYFLNRNFRALFLEAAATTELVPKGQVAADAPRHTLQAARQNATIGAMTTLEDKLTSRLWTTLMFSWHSVK